MTRFIQVVFVAVFALFGIALSPARAALLDTTGLNSLRAHLGENVNVTNIYTKSLGNSTATAWHDAVDGLGRTFTLIKVTFANNAIGETLAGPIIIGGYNPQSWTLNGGLNQTPNSEDRTAFLFNLTQRTFFDQISTGIYGLFQTFNYPNYGPAFGYGNDLYVDSRMDRGTVTRSSYGPPSYNILGTTGGWDFNAGEIETYAISAVPLPPSAILFGTALFGMGAAGFRRNRKQAKKLA